MAGCPSGNERSRKMSYVKVMLVVLVSVLSLGLPTEGIASGGQLHPGFANTPDKQVDYLRYNLGNTAIAPIPLKQGDGKEPAETEAVDHDYAGGRIGIAANPRPLAETHQGSSTVGDIPPHGGGGSNRGVGVDSD